MSRAKRAILHRLVYRIPLWLRRVGIRGYERILGVEWIALTTRGRRTGRPHTVMLDVVGRDASGFYVQPANGRGSQWVRNALAYPSVTVEHEGHRFSARAIDVTGEEGAEVVLRFVRSHPTYARLIARLVGFEDMTGRTDDEVRAAFRGEVVIALRPLP